MIIKKLKTATFAFDEHTKTLGIASDVKSQKDGVILDRVRMFSLARFILRVAQKPVKREGKHGGSVQEKP